MYCRVVFGSELCVGERYFLNGDSGGLENACCGLGICWVNINCGSGGGRYVLCRHFAGRWKNRHHCMCGAWCAFWWREEFLSWWRMTLISTSLSWPVLKIMSPALYVKPSMAWIIIRTSINYIWNPDHQYQYQPKRRNQVAIMVTRGLARGIVNFLRTWWCAGVHINKTQKKAT